MENEGAKYEGERENGEAAVHRRGTRGCEMAQNGAGWMRNRRDCRGIIWLWQQQLNDIFGVQFPTDYGSV